jgi:hypothetical protein
MSYTDIPFPPSFHAPSVCMLETEFPHKKLAGSDTFMRAPYMTSHLNFMTSHIAKDGNPGKDRDRFL